MDRYRDYGMHIQLHYLQVQITIRMYGLAFDG